LSYKETKGEEDLRRRIEQLKTEETTIRCRRQAMEGQLRRMIWQRMMKKVEVLEAVHGQR
jgi:hypothetical protein